MQHLGKNFKYNSAIHSLNPEFVEPWIETTPKSLSSRSQQCINVICLPFGFIPFESNARATIAFVLFLWS